MFDGFDAQSFVQGYRWTWRNKPLPPPLFFGVKQSLRNNRVLAGIACRSRVNRSAVPALERPSFLPALGVRVLRDSLTPKQKGDTLWDLICTP
jgi:hypothetical protein